MCRFAAYLGRPLLVNDVMSRPKVSLIRQSSSATESDVTLNGDGFGIGWYNLDVSEVPAVFVSALPAWNDMNLRNMSHQIQSSCFFAHVRAAEEGVVNQSNCHPFHYQKFLMMHNGGVGGFKKIKLSMLNALKPEFFHNIKGQTDSELLFALWLSSLEELEAPTQAHFISAWERTLTILNSLQKEAGVKEETYLNVIISDGHQLMGLRYVKNAEEGLTLHYAEGSAFIHHHGVCRMMPKENDHLHHPDNAVLIASERLTGDTPEWKDVPNNHYIFVDHHKRVVLTPVKN
jgi:glutamine amidotransferase